MDGRSNWNDTAAPARGSWTSTGSDIASRSFTFPAQAFANNESGNANGTGDSTESASDSKDVSISGTKRGENG